MAAQPLTAQDRGAAALGELIEGLGVSTRVLMIGAHPDDEDTFLITWLQRGRHVETAYLSLTRGDGGQNIIGNELGEALGVIRTEELLAARRIDGARQYFTRAFDFGFSKDTVDTFRHWARDSILGDVVRVVRMFRPHVMVAVFSGTPADGHGHHQVSGLMARAAYDLAGDTIRFPAREYGPAWTPLKFYRSARGTVAPATLSIDVGEYSALLGRSYGEIAGESRSQHKSQGFGAPQRRGTILYRAFREASRVNESTPAGSEKSLFDGIDTSWTRFAVTTGRARESVAALPAQFAAVRAAFDPFAPQRLVAPLARLRASLTGLCVVSCTGSSAARDLMTTQTETAERLDRALLLAGAVTLDVTTDRELVPVNRPTRVYATAYNRGVDTVVVEWAGIVAPTAAGAAVRSRVIPPGGMWTDTLTTTLRFLDDPWWLQPGRTGSMFPAGSSYAEGTVPPSFLTASVSVRGVRTLSPVVAPVTVRYVDQVKGELRRALAAAPLISVNMDASMQYVVAGADVDRVFAVNLRATDDSARDVRVTLALPRGLAADSATRTVRMQGYEKTATAAFRVRGRLAPGDYRIDALAEYNGETFARGYDLIDYDHIRRRRIYRPASIQLSAVDVKVPANLRVAYVTGVGDNVAPMLSQLGVPVTELAASDIGRADLSSYTTVVIGPRAYDAHPDLLAANPKLFDFARKGGVLLVQYGQYEMTQPGAMPFPITLSRPADRVTLEDAPVTIDAAGARELAYPNRITTSDFDGWVQERGLYMPRSFDPAYRSLFSTHDPNEGPIRSGVLVAPLGDGLYIYATLSFFRQLPAGVPGGARLFVNLLSAKLTPPGATP